MSWSMSRPRSFGGPRTPTSSRTASGPCWHIGSLTPWRTCTRLTRRVWGWVASATPTASWSGRGGAGPRSWGGARPPPKKAFWALGPPDGFLERQVRRWTQQLARSRSRDIKGFDDLAATLARRVPASQRASVVHGDYRLDNVLVGPDQQIMAVLDWEMATLGDPLCDLGLLPVYAAPVPGVAGIVSDGMGPHNGFPSIESLIGRYGERSGLDVSHLSWYTALGYYKLAVICEGIHYRYSPGQTVGAGFDLIGNIVGPLVSAGRRVLTESP